MGWDIHQHLSPTGKVTFKAEWEAYWALSVVESTEGFLSLEWWSEILSKLGQPNTQGCIVPCKD